MRNTRRSAAATAPYAHVLLISIDGLHALDLATFTVSHPQGALARPSSGGTVHRQAMPPLISDPFPGFAAQVTGGGPATTGLCYDDSYDRTQFPPGSAWAGQRGTEVPFASETDLEPMRADAGGTIGPRTAWRRSSTPSTPGSATSWPDPGRTDSTGRRR